jgi:hypothetical protein
MKNVVLRDLISYLKAHTGIETILFTGGNSKNGPEYFFRKHLKGKGLSLQLISHDIPKVHEFKLDNSTRTIRTISLTAPSGPANRAIGSTDLYKQRKQLNPEYNTMDFRVEQYQSFF